MQGQTRLEFIFGIAIFSMLIFFIVTQINTIFSSIISDYGTNRIKAEAESVMGLLTNYEGDPGNWTNFLGQGWERRKRIDIMPMPKELSNQQIKINVTWDPVMKNDFSDLRFTDFDMVTKIPYWIEKKSDGYYADVWVKVPKIPVYGGKSIYMYYGYSAASSESDGNGVFIHFLDLSGSSLPQGWVRKDIGTAGTATVSNGILKITNANGRDVWYNTYEATQVFKNSTVSGDFAAVAKVSGQYNNGYWGRIGISIQNNMEARNYNGQVNMVAFPGAGYGINWQSSQYYVTTHETSYSGSSPPSTFPTYLKLIRSNSTFSGWYSSDGKNWNRQGPSIVPIGVEDFQYVTLIESPVSGSLVGESNFSVFYVYRYTSTEPLVGFKSEEARTNESWFPIKTIGLLDNTSKYLSIEKINALSNNCNFLENLKIKEYRLKIYNSTSLMLFCGTETLKPAKLAISKNVLIGNGLGNITLELW